MDILKLTNVIKLAFLNNSRYITIPKPNKKVEKVVDCLIKNNVIIQQINKGECTILYINTSLKTCIKNIYKNSHKRTLTLSKLKKKYWHKTKNMYILSTSIGILSHHEAIKYGVGGVILFKIFN